jgi:hypothetical protein
MHQKTNIKTKIRTGQSRISWLLGQLSAGLILLCVMLFFSGCAGRQEANALGSLEPVTAGGYFVLAAEDVLIGMNFDIDKADMQNGVLRTRPLPGAQFFEFWRQDNSSFNSWLISNIHSIRRTAEVSVIEENQKISVDCVVRVQRLSMPSREVDSTARAYEIFMKNSPLLQRLQVGPQQEADMVWIDLGRDAELEIEILKRITGQITKYTTNSNLSIAESDGV